ncbi:MAG: acyl-CoA dehydrogenase family protein [Methanomassiliicoccales archaeon]
MNFETGEEHELVRGTVRRFAEEELAPVERRMDTEDYFPEELFRKLGALGMLGITIPSEYNGAGLDYISQAICLEEIAKISPAFALSVGAHSNLCLDNLYRNGSKEQRETFVPELASGKWIGCLGLTEPTSGSDALSLKTTATRTSGGYRLNGSKTFITNAPVADVAIVYARTAPEMGNRGLSAFIVRTNTPGFRRGKKFDKLGMRGSPTGEIFLDDCTVGADALLGGENQGTSIIMSGLSVERAVLAGISLGIQEAAMDIAVKYALERKQFGVSISEFEMIQEKIANMYVGVEASRLLIYRALQLLQRDKGRNREAAAAILFAAETSTKTAMDAIQILGGYGYMRDFRVEKLMRDAKLLEIGAGTSEIRRLIIAKDIFQKARG